MDGLWELGPLWVPPRFQRWEERRKETERRGHKINISPVL